MATEALDDYLDKIVKSILEADRMESSFNPIHADTMRTTWDYSHSNKSMVFDYSPDLFDI